MSDGEVVLQGVDEGRGTPILVLHGSQDEIAPMRMGRELFEAANEPKQWVEISGAHHNDTPYVDPARYWGFFLRFWVER